MKVKRISAIWCPSCLIMEKRWKKIEHGYPQIEFEDYDYDEHEEMCEALEIGKKLPVCIFYKEDKEIGRMIGEKSEKEMIEKLEEWKK